MTSQSFKILKLIILRKYEGADYFFVMISFLRQFVGNKQEIPSDKSMKEYLKDLTQKAGEDIAFVANAVFDPVIYNQQGSTCFLHAVA